MIHDLLISIQDLLSSLLAHWKSILGSVVIAFVGVMIMISFFED